MKFVNKIINITNTPDNKPSSKPLFFITKPLRSPNIKNRTPPIIYE